MMAGSDSSLCGFYCFGGGGYAAYLNDTGSYREKLSIRFLVNINNYIGNDWENCSGASLVLLVLYLSLVTGAVSVPVIKGY